MIIVFNDFVTLGCVPRVVTAGQQECAQSLKTPWLVFTVAPLLFEPPLQIVRRCKVWFYACLKVLRATLVM